MARLAELPGTRPSRRQVRVAVEKGGHHTALGVRIERVRVTHQLGSKSGKGNRKKELLIRKF